MTSTAAFLDFALDAAWQAGRVTLAHFQAGVAVDRKGDGSPVTVADRDAERLIRRLVADRFPDHAIVGEEFGAADRDASHRWIVDPIDGTNSFIRGVPFYGVLLALEIDGDPVVGVAHFPGLGDMIGAARGGGCRWNGREARVSTVSSLAEACMTYTDGREMDVRLGEGWRTLQDATAIQRGWGDCYGHCLVATGRADVMLDPRMHAWDCAALVPILEEAGGRFTDWRGARTIEGDDAVATNGALHEQVLAILNARA
jgi:histidinol phosphatase-like enzyme (inositol monophosphatase family)